MRVDTYEYPFSFTFPSYCDLGADAGKLRDYEMGRSGGSKDCCPLCRTQEDKLVLK